MKKEQIQQLFEQFEHARYIFNEIECWSGRDLQQIYNYSDWRNFLKVIDKAKDACKNCGEAVSNHFVETNKMVLLGSGSEREIEDIAPTRYACYLVALNGNSAKSEVAFAQTYEPRSVKKANSYQ